MNEAFLKIINMSISASWVVLVVLILRLVLKKAPKWVNVLLWGIVAVRLICPFTIESALSLIPSAETIPMNIEMAANPAIDSGINGVNNMINPTISDSFTPSPENSANPLQIWISLAAFLWITGMVVMMLYTVISYWSLRRKVDTAVIYKNNIFQSENVTSPFVLGIIKPKIYLPFQLDGQNLKHIVAHERAHIQRKDHLWKPLGFLLLTIHWFNPLMWIAYVLLCRDIELACDEKVIKKLGNEQRADYTQALVACSVNRRMIAACPVAFGEVGVKDRVKSVMNYKKPAFWMIVIAVTSCVVVAICFLTNPVAEVQPESEENIESDNSIYENVIANMGDQAAYAFLVMDYDHNVLLTSDLIYDDGTEQQASVACDVYYCVDGEAKKLGTLMSDGTAYPITFTNEGIFVASGHKIEKYIISDENALYLAKGIYESFDEVGSVTYTSITGEQDSESTEQEYLDLIREYEKSQIVHFSYGAEHSVNEYQRKEDGLDAGEPNMDSEEVQRELERVVSSIGLENAFPWNNAVELKKDADALIKMASDETGRFEIYGIMSEKYGTYGFLLNDGLGGEQNWNYAYVPWVYSGASSEQPTLETDGDGKYVFAYVYKYDDVPLWQEYILDCGYNTGHMELISKEETAPSVAGVTMVDASKIASIVITNGNTGEQKTVTGQEVYSEDYYFFNDLRKLYSVLDFSVQAVENERVGYQYSMVLYDADGNKLQRVTPYKDGLTVDRVFYQYDDTGEGAKASLRLMEYMEYVFDPVTTPFTEVAVNTLPNLTMTMEEYKFYEGELIISNQTGNDLKTWEWYDIQKWEDGAWHRLDQLTDGMWKDVLYVIPAGEVAVLPTNWETWYGDLPSGKYRIIKEIYQTIEDEIHTHYIAAEFEIP